MLAPRGSCHVPGAPLTTSSAPRCKSNNDKNPRFYPDVCDRRLDPANRECAALMAGFPCQPYLSCNNNSKGSSSIIPGP